MNLKNLMYVLLLLSIFTSSVFAQGHTKQSADLTYTFGTNQGYIAGTFHHDWLLGSKQKFQIGLGARFTSYNGKDQNFITAPAILTAGKSGPGAFFEKPITANIDSVLFAKAQTNSLNLSLNFGYNLSSKLLVGFNIDAIGFSFGSEQNAAYSNRDKNILAVPTTAKPSGFNALLIGDNDKGSLNSELFAQYKVGSKLSVKAGLGFLFSEYTTATEIQTAPSGVKNDRFRNKVGGLSLGLAYQF